MEGERSFSAMVTGACGQRAMEPGGVLVQVTDLLGRGRRPKKGSRKAMEGAQQEGRWPMSDEKRIRAAINNEELRTEEGF